MPDDRPTISSSRVAAADVARHSFDVVRRGFDPQEVRAFLELVARELSAWEQHEDDLRQQVADADERSRHPVIDEATLTAALGQQSAAVLRNAHDEAARITLAADEAAAALTREAQQHATDALVRAESAAAERIAEAEIAATTVQQQARQEVATMLDAARAEGEALVERARLQGRGMIDQAQDARRRVLADMAQRRRAVTLQIEQFRAARDELAAAVLGLRDTVDRAAGDLVRADDDARAAAADVARRQQTDVPDTALAAEVDRAVADLAAAGAVFDIDDFGPFPAAPPAGPPAVSATPADVGNAHGELDVDTDEADGPAGTDAIGDVDALVTVAAAVDVPDELDAVEDLFARLRASHPGDVTNLQPSAAPEPADTGEATPAAGTPVADDPAPPTPVVDEETGEVEEADGEPGEAAAAAEDPAAAAIPGDEATEDDVSDGAVPDDASEAADEVDEAGPDEAGPDEIGPDQAALDSRAELLDPVVAKLARRLKRTLQDDQNRLLDVLRSGSGDRLGTVLPAEDDQRAVYTEAASADLRDAAVAGIAFTRRQLGTTRGRAPAPDAAAVAQVAAGLANTVVTLLRRRLAEDENAGPDADRIGAAYREWRGARIERLVGDAALEAFSSGVISAAGTAGLRWVLAGNGTGCADCDDNALADVIGRGEDFPTGHRHPPAHAGCRCLVVPTPV